MTAVGYICVIGLCAWVGFTDRDVPGPVRFLAAVVGLASLLLLGEAW